MSVIIGASAAVEESEPERVMTIPWVILRDKVPTRGLVASDTFWPELIADGFIMYPWRDRVENDVNFKHVATYCLCWMDIDGVRHYLTYRRGAKGEGEGRLEGKYSLGVGGHVNSKDRVPLQAASRELREEYPGGYARCRSLRLVGVINDDTNEVGRVHLGALCFAEITMPAFGRSPELILGECGLREARYRTLDEIREEPVDRWEGWSQILFQALDRGLDTAA